MRKMCKELMNLMIDIFIESLEGSPSERTLDFLIIQIIQNFCEFYYSAKSWNNINRRIVAKVEYSEKGPNQHACN